MKMGAFSNSAPPNSAILTATDFNLTIHNETFKTVFMAQ